MAAVAASSTPVRSPAMPEDARSLLASMGHDPLTSRNSVSAGYEWSWVEWTEWI
jgi:hypothetical protein